LAPVPRAFETFEAKPRGRALLAESATEHAQRIPAGARVLTVRSILVSIGLVPLQ